MRQQLKAEVCQPPFSFVINFMLMYNYLTIALFYDYLTIILRFSYNYHMSYFLIAANVLNKPYFALLCAN